MTKIISIYKIILLGLLFSCTIKQPKHELELHEYYKPLQIPPGTLKLSNNLFIDDGEISNFSYLEFMYWVERIYGKNSEEYISILPDTKVWNDLINIKLCCIMSDYYLHHPIFKERPVVGVTYEQALKFCKWRSDRVMEYILIKYKILDHNPKPHKDSTFSIESYFTEKYKNIKPNPYIRFYPVYSLPDSLTFLKSLPLADSINNNNYKYYRKKENTKGLIDIRCIENMVKECAEDSSVCGFDPTKSCYYIHLNNYKFLMYKPLLTNLLGNVCEMTIKKGLSFGGSFIDSCETVKKQHFYSYTKPNAYTGFRCVCTWKKWP